MNYEKEITQLKKDLHRTSFDITIFIIFVGISSLVGGKIVFDYFLVQGNKDLVWLISLYLIYLGAYMFIFVLIRTINTFKDFFKKNLNINP